MLCCITGVTTTFDSVPVVDFTIEAEHPFVFFIVDDVNSLALFSGWVVAP